MSLFKPMLAASLDGVDLSTLRYPLLVSPKLDGVRALVGRDGVVYSRNHKPIRNAHVQHLFGSRDYADLDGELVVGHPTDPGVFNTTQSGVMSAEGEPDVWFHVFDIFHERHMFHERAYQVRNCQLANANGARVFRVTQHTARTPDELLDLEAEFLRFGYEGVILRDPNGLYKQGRSTLREGGMLKLKRFIDGEGVVVRLEEAEHNDNAPFKDELGRTKRTTHKAGRRGAGMVGALVLSTEQWGELRVAPGVMPHADRVRYWNMPQLLLRKTAHWRAFGYGVKDRPRFPRFYGLREDV